MSYFSRVAFTVKGMENLVLFLDGVHKLHVKGHIMPCYWNLKLNIHRWYFLWIWVVKQFYVCYHNRKDKCIYSCGIFCHWMNLILLVSTLENACASVSILSFPSQRASAHDHIASQLQRRCWFRLRCRCLVCVNHGSSFYSETYSAE
jgi:hypothetical protein